MSFNPNKCAIPTVYCGKNPKIPARKKGDDHYYVRKGTPNECMSKGFGAGMINERNKKLPDNSLQQIKYVGDTYDSKFKKNHKIKNVNDLIKYAKKYNVQRLLTGVFTKKDGKLDMRAYNSTLLYLYRVGVTNLPTCKNIKL